MIDQIFQNRQIRSMCKVPCNQKLKKNILIVRKITMEYRFMCSTATPSVFQEHLEELEAAGIEHHFDASIYAEGEGCAEVLVCKTKDQRRWVRSQSWLDIADECVIVME